MSRNSLPSGGGERYAPRFEVRVGDRTFRSGSDPVGGLRVEQTSNAATRLSLRHGHDRAAAIEEAPWETVEVGAPLEVRLGYSDDAPVVFGGSVDAVRPVLPADGCPYGVVSGYDPIHELARQESHDAWRETTLGELVQDLTAGRPFEDVDVDRGVAEVPLVEVRHEEGNDLRLLGELARDYGFGFDAATGALRVRDPGRDDEPAVTLAYGESLRSLTPTDPGGQPRAKVVEVRGEAEEASVTPKARAEVTGDGEGMVVREAAVGSVAEASRRAAALARRLANPPRFRGVTVGHPGIRVGEPLALSGLGERFSGTYRVERAIHSVDDAGYTTEFEVVREP
jgi:phage protein D